MFYELLFHEPMFVDTYILSQNNRSCQAFWEQKFFYFILNKRLKFISRYCIINTSIRFLNPNLCKWSDHTC